MAEQDYNTYRETELSVIYIDGTVEKFPHGWDAIPHGGWMVFNDFRGRNKKYIPAHLINSVRVDEVAA
ncbi:hypothetical protein [Neorhizobium galegae]|uniref:Uncharacterized protein n=1 Tax=Neorhizobium galegae bv. orientalis str. HAMBI 540 TaxID=1028800 RepID=A0A068SL00_NEOGA|nr:hypothetical protein [Neorhizobium galegae]MCQ1856148.1 hypothetical protein [Neorhizobium galegae]CDN46848.1 Hypothetical protein RG540_CH06580 [Neorhizobium galegae bv. orientalis str. HAMBI 540]